MSPRPPDGAARFISKPGLGLRQPVITTDLERIAHQKGGPIPSQVKRVSATLQVIRAPGATISRRHQKRWIHVR